MNGARWWIEAQGRAWGPYPAERLSAFRDEGRFDAASRVAATAEGPFAPAGEIAELADLFAATVLHAPAAEDGAAAPAVADARTVLVVTDATGPELAPLETSLGEHGTFVRVRPGLWLLRGPFGAAVLRNVLSRRLRGAAMLLVVEAPLGSAGWFNVGGDTDRALRRLWTEPRG